MNDRVTSDDLTTWRAIEQEAREQVQAELATADIEPLEFGRFVAWAELSFAHTDALSHAHRVGDPMRHVPMTLCGEVIPAAIRMLPLTPNLVRTLGRCRYCESLYAKAGGRTSDTSRISVLS